VYFTWSPRSRALAEGLLEHERSIGPHGIRWRDALDPDNDGYFEVRERMDYAQAALDQFQKDNTSKDTEPGVRPYVVFTRGDVDEDEEG
jgi:hypothetical protein